MVGSSFINVELTSRCNANCWCCGRRKLEREHPSQVDWGDMDFDLLKEISRQVPPGTITQFHWNGEPTLFPRLGDALDLFPSCTRQFNTNGKLIVEKSDEIINHLEVLTISVVEKEETDEQYETVRRFLEIKGDRLPLVVYRLLGQVSSPERWASLPGVVATRVLHSPMGSRDYQRKVTIPEIGICLDLLTHLAIDRYGNISLCVRFDPHGHLRIGHVETTGLEGAWNSEKRRFYIEQHIAGRRDKLPGCDACHYWGVPIGD